MVRLKLLILVLSAACSLATPPIYRGFFSRFNRNRVQFNHDPWQPMTPSPPVQQTEESSSPPGQSASYVTKHHHYVQYGDEPPRLVGVDGPFGAPGSQSGSFSASAAEPSGSYGTPAAPISSYGAPTPEPAGSYGVPTAQPAGSYGVPTAQPSGSYGAPAGPVPQVPVVEQHQPTSYQYSDPAPSYGLPAVTSTKLEEAGNIFQAQAPKDISLGGQQSFFYSPKENALYQVTKIQLGQAPGNAIPLDLAASYGVPLAPSAEVPQVSGVSEADGAPSSQIGSPVVEYGPPKTTTTPAPATTVVYRYKTRPKFNFTLDIIDNECYEEVTPEQAGENKNPNLTPQPIKYYRKKRGVDPVKCNGPETGTAPNPLKPLYGAPVKHSTSSSVSSSGSYSVSVQGGAGQHQAQSYQPPAPSNAPPASDYGVPAPSTTYGAPASISYGTPAPAVSYGLSVPSATYDSPDQNGHYDEFEAAGPASALTGRRGGSRVRISASSEFGR